MELIKEALSRPADAFRRGSKTAAWVPAGVAILINAAFEPLLRLFCSENAKSVNIAYILLLTLLGVLSYLAISGALYAVCRLFGSNVTLSGHIRAWGVTFFPTALCALAVAFSETFFYIFWNNSVWGTLLGFLFIGVLLWKTILFCMYLGGFAGLRGARFAGAFAVTGALIIALALLNAKVGLKTPML